MIIAVAQALITPNVENNRDHIRALMERAAEAGARVVHFPEGALSGYVKSEVKAWEDVDWNALDHELAAIALHAGRLGVWLVLGCNHRLAAPLWPHNSL